MTGSTVLQLTTNIYANLVCHPCICPRSTGLQNTKVDLIYGF